MAPTGDYFTEQYLDSCGISREAVVTILASIAKQECVRLSEWMIPGLQRGRKAGRVGRRPKVICDQVNVEWLWAAGKSLTEITAPIRRLEEFGAPDVAQ